MQVFDFLALVLVLVRLLVIRTFACICSCAAAAAGSDRCCCAKQNCIMTVCVRAMLCWFFSGDFWLSGVMGVQSTAHYHIYIQLYTHELIYSGTFCPRIETQICRASSCSMGKPRFSYRFSLQPIRWFWRWERWDPISGFVVSMMRGITNTQAPTYWCLVGNGWVAGGCWDDYY